MKNELDHDLFGALVEPENLAGGKAIVPIGPLLGFLDQLDSEPLEARVSAINQLRSIIAARSPFSSEPVDCVTWVKAEEVAANDYNPNSVAPPEMKLLQLSVQADGYTQPIVANEEDGKFVVVDGFHRNRVGREVPEIRERLHGYLPVVQIRASQQDRSHRIASTIRHNRARGKHRVEAMSDIVVELKRRNWTNERICRELGMDNDEVLRLCQITGLAELFADQEFSKSWDVEGAISPEDFVELSEEATLFADDPPQVRTANTNDDARIFHTYEKWECFKAGLYATHFDGMSKADGELAYRDFLSDLPRFEKALAGVISTWKHSCEHYLTNQAMNRIAWLGQAAICFDMGLPAEFRAGFFKLTEAQQTAANEMALVHLNKWLVANGRAEVSLEEGYSGDRQSDIY